jgi:putative phosphoesterase
MTRIGLLSDTHSFVHPGIFEFFKDCDQVWHAGDIGDPGTLNLLSDFKPVRAVYGNIDGQHLRTVCSESLFFRCEDVKVLMIHIGGYPKRYEKKALQLIDQFRPNLFITGHSHILKVQFDKEKELLHINPGAAGKYGLHQVITIVRFEINGNKIENLEILELPRNQHS